MIVNDINIEEIIGVVVLSFDKQPREIVNYDDWITGALTPIMTLPEEYRYNLLTIKLLVVGNDLEDIEEKESKLQRLFTRGILKEDDSKYLFPYIYQNGTKMRINRLANEITYMLYSPYMYKEEKNVTLAKSSSQEITVEGTTKTPCTYEINALTSIIDFEINSIKVHDIPLGSTLVIDGKKCLITIDGTNKFGDSTLIEFPFLVPGKNTIKVNNVNCEIKVKYEPRYI